MSEFGKTNVETRRVVGVDGQPGVDQLRIRWTGGCTAHRRARCLTEQRIAEAEADNESAAGFQEFAAGKPFASDEAAHFVTSAIACEARCTAFKILG